MSEPRVQVRFIRDNCPALVPQEGLERRSQRLRRLIRHQAEINGDYGVGWNGVGGCRANLARADTADVKRRPHETGRQLVSAFSSGYAELPFQLVFNRRKATDRLQLHGRYLADTVGEAWNKNPALVIAHLCDQSRCHRRRIGNPVAIMAVMQRLDGPINRHTHTRYSPCAEINHLSPGLVQWRVTYQP